MAVAAVGAVGLTGAGTGVAGFVIGIGAAVVDATVIMPWLAGKGRQDAVAPRVRDNPVGSNQPGAPRVWAIGARVRVQTHVLWQKEKIREATTTHRKEGTIVEQRQVMVDCAISLNDRLTSEMTQLIGNGKLLVWESRNLQRITTHEMSAAVSGSDVVITMANTLVPSPTDVFKVGDVVKLYGWVMTAGADINGSYWGIRLIQGHTSTPGTITLEPAQGQVVASVAATAGDPFTPAHIERVDDAFVGDPDTTTGRVTTGLGGGPNLGVLVLRLPADKFAADIFNADDRVYVHNVWFTSGFVGGPHLISSSILCKVTYLSGNEVGIFPVNPGSLTQTQWPAQVGVGNNVSFLSGPTNWPRIVYANPTFLATPFFPQGFVPKDHYHEGSDTQLEDPTIAGGVGVGNAPGYRGVAYQVLQQFRVTTFGGQLPYSMEAIIKPDLAMTWAQAIYETLRRAGIPSNAIDVDGVSLAPFLGYYVIGHVPTSTSIQPLLLAKQIVGQDRDGKLCMFQIENADVTQIQNGPAFSDLGAHIYGEQRTDEKILTEDGAEEDLPTSVGVRHQDPDNLYTDGYQTFGIRNPTGPSFENRQEIDVHQLVLTRKDAKNLAATTVRRSAMNNRSYKCDLTACYLDQIENDVVTMTDDSGNIITARLAQVDKGANYIVKSLALREDLELAVSGSPVQTAAGQVPPTVAMPATFISLVLDISSLANEENSVPMLRFAVCAVTGGHWAGGRLFESTDGTNFSPVNFLADQSVIGSLQADTPAVAGPSETYGSSTVTFFNAPVDVTFDYEGPFGIQPTTQVEAQYTGRNLCAIVDAVTGEVELAAFTQVTLVSARTYTLNGWLRGLRGTRTAVRPANSKLVMLAPSWEYPTLTRTYPGLSQQTALAFKFVPAGRTVEEVAAIGITASWRNCRPLPVRRLEKSIGLSPFSVRFTTEHWTKEHLPVGALGPYNMDEPFEGYKFSIYDPSGGGVRRVKWLLATPASGTTTLRDKFVDYTPAEQTADGYTPGAATTFVVEVQQVGFLGQVSGLSDSNKRTV